MLFSLLQLPQVDPMAIKLFKVCKTGGLQSVRVVYNMAFVDGELCPHGLTFVWLKQDWTLITVLTLPFIFSWLFCTISI